jgi:opacity protein-like surface antigen
MKTNILRNAALAALVTTASAVSAFAADYTPFVRAEATLTDSGYDFANAPEGFELGAAFTGGVLIDGKHEVSITTGHTKWEGDTFGPVGVARTSFEVEQVPVLLNYRFHLSPAKKLTVFVGPTVGLVHETATGNVLQNVGPVPGLKPVGSYDDSSWKTAFGGSLGLSYAFAEGWELNAAAQVLRLNSKSYELNSSISKFDLGGNSTRVGFSLGATYRW